MNRPFDVEHYILNTIERGQVPNPMELGLTPEEVRELNALAELIREVDYGGIQIYKFDTAEERDKFRALFPQFVFKTPTDFAEIVARAFVKTLAIKVAEMKNLLQMPSRLDGLGTHIALVVRQPRGTSKFMKGNIYSKQLGVDSKGYLDMVAILQGGMNRSNLMGKSRGKADKRERPSRAEKPEKKAMKREDELRRAYSALNTEEKRKWRDWVSSGHSNPRVVVEDGVTKLVLDVDENVPSLQDYVPAVGEGALGVQENEEDRAPEASALLFRRGDDEFDFLR